jgi:small subunit ribosomal protein S13
MARIAGVELPNKHVDVALTYIFGVGRSAARKICETARVDPDARMNEVSAEEVNRVRQIIETDYMVEGRLRTEISLNIKRLMDIGCYRGMRHRKGLPVRGQRTRTNARTRKGKKRTVAGKKRAPSAK